MNNKKNACTVRKTSIGGQALIEGIMMRGPKQTAMAVRNTEGEIVLEKWETKTVSSKKITKLPLIRGIFSYVDSMVFGYKCLMRSAEISGLEEAEEELRREKEAKKEKKLAKKKSKSVEPSAEDLKKEESGVENEDHIDEDVVETTAKEEDKKEKKEASFMSTLIMVVAVVFSLAFSFLVLLGLPSLLFDLFAKLVPSVEDDRWIRSIFEGIIKLFIIVGYMALVSLMKDIKRTFMFHGAEHKAIFCYEQGLELNVENIRMQKRFHPRCGTSFLILMVLVNILISFFIPPTLKTPFRVAIKFLTLPVMVGIGYELIKLAGRHDNWFTRMISAPGVWLQRITTKEPDDDMIECAIVALKEVIPDDESDKW